MTSGQDPATWDWDVSTSGRTQAEEQAANSGLGFVRSSVAQFSQQSGALMLEFHLPVESAAQAVTVWGIKDKLIGVILQTLQDLKGELPDKATVMAAAKAAFEKYVVPIDIPNIGPVIEHVVDEAMENLFLRFVSTAYDRIAAA